MSQYVTASKASEILSLGPRGSAKITGFIEIGILPAQKNGNSWVITKDDLKTFAKKYNLPVINSGAMN